MAQEQANVTKFTEKFQLGKYPPASTGNKASSPTLTTTRTPSPQRQVLSDRKADYPRFPTEAPHNNSTITLQALT